MMLGMNQLRMLVIASGMVNSVPSLEGFNLKQFWSDSFRIATHSKWFAAECKAAPDVAFTAGLISGFGTLLIHMGAPSAANEIDQHIKPGHSRSEIEINRLGFTSEDLCAELCKRWHFSKELIDAIAQCGSPLEYQPMNKIAGVVYISRYISDCLHVDADPKSMLGTFPFEIAKELGFSEQYIIEKLPEVIAIESGLDELSE